MMSARDAISVREVLGLDAQSLERVPLLLNWPGPGKPCGAPRNGLKALMQAVLEEGVRNYLGRDARLHAEAECWIVSLRRDFPFAFDVVCETLGLEPSAVRVALGQLRKKHWAGRVFKRTRPNARRAGGVLAQKVG